MELVWHTTFNLLYLHPFDIPFSNSLHTIVHLHIIHNYPHTLTSRTDHNNFINVSIYDPSIRCPFSQIHCVRRRAVRSSHKLVDSTFYLFFLQNIIRPPCIYESYVNFPWSTFDSLIIQLILLSYTFPSSFRRPSRYDWQPSCRVEKSEFIVQF